MKIKVLIDPGAPEAEVIVRSPEMTDEVSAVAAAISDAVASANEVIFYQKEKEFYFTVNKILFFETEGNNIFAHTGLESYEVHHKLYELEELLPTYFMRVSKSAIVNTRQIYSITRNITASSLVEFRDTHKKVYVSRNYYKQLHERMNENRGM